MLTEKQHAEIERLLVDAGLGPGLADTQLYMGLSEQLLGLLGTMVNTTLAHMSSRERLIAAFVVTKSVAESLEAVLNGELQG